MTNKMKAFLEAVSKDKEIKEKLKVTNDKDEIIAIAKEFGLELTEADLIPQEDGELSENELNAVAGGGACACVVGGGGTAGDREDDICYCALVGMGAHDILDEKGDVTSYYWRCYCVGAGGGTDDE